MGAGCRYIGLDIDMLVFCPVKFILGCLSSFSAQVKVSRIVYGPHCAGLWPYVSNQHNLRAGFYKLCSTVAP